MEQPILIKDIAMSQFNILPQVNPGALKYGRFNPMLEIVDLFEDYTDDGTGKSAKIVTRTDGNEDAYIPNFHNMNNASVVNTLMSVPFLLNITICMNRLPTRMHVCWQVWLCRVHLMPALRLLSRADLLRTIIAMWLIQTSLLRKMEQHIML